MQNDIKLKNPQVRVSARDFSKIKNQGHDFLDYLENACGAIGAAIAMNVIDNEGWADFNLADIRMGFAVQCGVEALLDNFELSVTETGEPLIDFLSKSYLGL